MNRKIKCTYCTTTMRVPKTCYIMFTYSACSFVKQHSCTHMHRCTFYGIQYKYVYTNIIWYIGSRQRSSNSSLITIIRTRLCYYDLYIDECL